MKTKRLFLFAGYNAKGVIDDALVHYVNSLEKFGDIVLVMDSNCTETELKKVQKQCVYTAATRPGEYDFGSYKRAYIWACENLKIADYDFVYMVNDSVYGPMFDMAPYFQKMESMNYDAFAIYGDSTLVIYAIPLGKNEIDVVEDEKELTAVASIFEELLDDLELVTQD